MYRAFEQFGYSGLPPRDVLAWEIDDGPLKIGTQVMELAGGAIARAEVALDDVVDLPSMLACLDAAAASVGDARRCYEHRELGWGQEGGILLATDEQAEALRRSGHIADPDDEDDDDDDD